MTVEQCVICQCAIWHTEGGLCLEHQGFAILWSLVAVGAFTDFPDSSYSHRELQKLPRKGDGWLTVLDDINRMARYWLDGWQGENAA